MADWTNIPNSSLEPGKPIRSIDGLALRDNPIAIALGAAGAPRVLPSTAINWAASTNTAAERDWVLNRTALAAVGTVGTYAFLRPDNTIRYGPGATLAGSSLRYSGGLTGVAQAGADGSAALDGAAPAGTWRCMGNRVAVDPSAFGPTDSSRASTLWLRIS